MSATAFLVARKGASYELLDAGEQTTGLRKKFKHLSTEAKDSHDYDGLYYADTRGAVRQKRFSGKAPQKMPVAKKEKTAANKAAKKGKE